MPSFRMCVKNLSRLFILKSKQLSSVKLKSRLQSHRNRKGMTRREGKTKRSGTGRIKRGKGGYGNRGDEKAERALFGRKVIRNRAQRVQGRTVEKEDG